MRTSFADNNRCKHHVIKMLCKLCWTLSVSVVVIINFVKHCVARIIISMCVSSYLFLYVFQERGNDVRLTWLTYFGTSCTVANDDSLGVIRLNSIRTPWETVTLFTSSRAIVFLNVVKMKLQYKSVAPLTAGLNTDVVCWALMNTYRR